MKENDSLCLVLNYSNLVSLPYLTRPLISRRRYQLLFGGIIVTVAIKAQGSSRVNSPSLLLPLQKCLVALKRVWWHGKALVPIIGIVLVALASLLFLHLHWSFRSQWK